MREIKFRGKRLDNGEWVYGYAAKFAHGSVPVILEETEDGIDSRKVIPDTVGQFTGLHDKNGKEIYEGDIVKQTWGFPHYVKGILYDCFGRIGDIRYECDLIGVHTKNGLYRIVGSDISNEVIGNIHDNPELLKTK